MRFNRYYRYIVTQLNAITFAIDHLQTYGPESRQKTSAVKALEKRVEILREKRKKIAARFVLYGKRQGQKEMEVISHTNDPDELEFVAAPFRWAGLWDKRRKRPGKQRIIA